MRPTDNVQQYFKKLKFFIDDNPSTSWIVKAGDGETFYSVSNNNNDSFLYREVKLPSAANNFTLTLSFC
ncbi:MAG: hypothetical protein WDM90_24255 [Ferruginibacter sp.]